MILNGKRILVTGVVTRESIGYAVAEQAQLAGAEVILTSFGRPMRLTERSAKGLPRTPEVLELDVNEPEHFQRLRSDLEQRWSGIDGALHAIAFQTSAYSLKSLAQALLPLFDGGGSIVGLDFDAQVAWPVYDWMGVAKAALEAVSRYLARDLGPHGVRVNLVSAGPLETLAARGIPGFRELVDMWSAQAPLGWDSEDREPVARACCYLLSDWSRGISGEILHVDGGFHAMGAPLEMSRATETEPAETAAP